MTASRIGHVTGLGKASKATTGPPARASAARVQARTEPVQLAFLMRLANALNATLDLQTIMHQTAELVRAVIDFRIFAILLLNDRTNDLRMRLPDRPYAGDGAPPLPHRRRHHRRGRLAQRAGADERCAHCEELCLAPTTLCAPSWRCR